MIGPVGGGLLLPGGRCWLTLMWQWSGAEMGILIIPTDLRSHVLGLRHGGPGLALVKLDRRRRPGMATTEAGVRAMLVDSDIELEW
ncbi:hypothetical protein ACTQ40_09935 [Collinsella sp. Sow4_D11]|uniref:hypothetical protein n=1 Tax=Collinsella sp. Sow4_D11 TaxID=3438775 RepID=UPI003F932B22